MQKQQFLDLITSEHQTAPNFMALVGLFAQWGADRQALLASMPQAFDLDTAIGVQLDAVGLWVGKTRFLDTPLQVYFSWDTTGLGWDQGVWFFTYDPITGLTRLDDNSYRTLLRAAIVANHWDGTVPGAYDAWNTLFAGTGYSVLIQDGYSYSGFFSWDTAGLGWDEGAWAGATTETTMHMTMALLGPSQPDAVTKALFENGELGLKPVGVSVTYWTQSVPGVPYFGFDVENSSISGWDTGAWGTIGQTV